MTPAVAAYRMVCALTLGAALGTVYGFLRPLRPRHTLLSDGLFLAVAAWVWIYLCFGVCAGDIRAGFAFCLLAGGILWESTFGRWLRPFFFLFWKGMGALLDALGLPAKKFFVFSKFLFASVKKWVTIEKTISDKAGNGAEGIPMKEFKTGKVKVRLRTAPAGLKIALILLILFSITALVALRWVHNGIQAQTLIKQEQAAAMEGENTDLREKIENVGSVQGIRQIAQDELGLADPDTVLIHPE